MSRYENYEIKNNVFGTLSAPISSLATAIQLGDGQGQRFSENMLATLENIENGKVMKREIVLITAINGDTLTVTRKYAPCPDNDEANTQGQVSYAFSTDDTISAYIDKEHFDELDKSINDIYDNGVNKLRTEVISGLQIKVNAGPVLVGSSYYDFEGGNLTLTDNATNYIEIDEDGLLVSNTTSWTLENTKIAKVITSSGAVISIEDWRLGTVGGKIGGTDIHELTEKNTINSEDEFIIADSENIYQNKKIKAGNLLGIGNGVAGENISKGDFVFSENIVNSDNGFVGVGYTNAQKISIKRVGNGVQFDSINLIVLKNGTPTTLYVRIESDNNGEPSGNLIDENAYGNISGGDVNNTPTTIAVNLAGNVTIQDGTVCHIVFATDTISDSNTFGICGYETTPKLFKIKQYDGSVWNDFVEYGAYFNVLDYTNVGAVSMNRTATQLSFSQDGKHLCFAANSSYIYSYELNVPFSLADGLTNSKSYALGNSSYYTVGVRRNEDGTKCIGATLSGIGVGTLSTPRDISTWSGPISKSWTNIGFPGSNVSSFIVSTDGKHLYQVYQNYIRQVDLSTARDISGSYTYIGQKTISAETGGGSVTTIAFSPDGKWLYAYGGGGNRKLVCYKLSTPRDVTTATYHSISANVIGTATWSGLGFMTNKNLVFAYNQTSLQQYSSKNPFGVNALCNITADGLYEGEMGKADNTMSLGNYIPCASMLDYIPGQKVKYNILYNDNKIGLVPGTKYYLGTGGGITDTENDYEVGIAIEPTILKLKQTY